jgi:membrane protease YdiL (CAAX protease family)
MLFRLIVFKLIEEFTSRWISLLISAFTFGFMHIFNSHATLWSLGLLRLMQDSFWLSLLGLREGFGWHSEFIKG